MSNNLRLLLVIFSIILMIIVFRLIYKKKIQISFSLFWLLSAIVILIVGAFPNFINIFTRLIGFETTSNFTIGIILGLLLFNTLILTIIVTEQNKKITLLIQEISILKEQKNEESINNSTSV